MGDEGISALENVTGPNRDVLESVCGLKNDDHETGGCGILGQEYVAGWSAQVA